MTNNTRSTAALFWSGVIVAAGSLILLLLRALTDSLTTLGVLAHLATFTVGLVLIWQHRRATKKS
ncbi:hypothetical protein CLV85_0088 [Salinibacterium amurskyense]|uniref:Uncharacterized protein n=1 Tax=Salinibacterium amurskyense TaxID=205941 RepID=A0A2M9D5C7_9MICO|nr:hypothetical protein [Salinibacterium amurskyense]PJJ80921.1 hypothetical protein CLV85_0088 [Salinibacterium amurskyense]RLQ82965.1 hypothetical protein D9C83_00440 [Salinibacterium amurskyense]